jgi:hypothetical protein
VPRRNLGRAQMEKFFAQQAPTDVVMKACGSAHHWWMEPYAWYRPEAPKKVLLF